MRRTGTRRVRVDALDEALRLDVLHLLPRSGDIGHGEPRVVDEVEVHVAHAQLYTDSIQHKNHHTRSTEWEETNARSSSCC
jgi:hypothetical protein